MKTKHLIPLWASLGMNIILTCLLAYVFIHTPFTEEFYWRIPKFLGGGEQSILAHSIMRLESASPRNDESYVYFAGNGKRASWWQDLNRNTTQKINSNEFPKSMTDFEFTFDERKTVCTYSRYDLISSQIYIGELPFQSEFRKANKQFIFEWLKTGILRYREERPLNVKIYRGFPEIIINGEYYQNDGKLVSTIINGNGEMNYFRDNGKLFVRAKYAGFKLIECMKFREDNGAIVEHQSIIYDNAGNISPIWLSPKDELEFKLPKDEKKEKVP